MPIDLMYGTRDQISREDLCYCSYVEGLRARLQEAYARARVATCKAAEREKKYYDVSLKPRKFVAGQWVLRWHPPSKAKTLGKGWHPYVITRVCSDLVYEIQRDPSSRKFTVHANHLRVCKSLAGRSNWIRDTGNDAGQVQVPYQPNLYTNVPQSTTRMIPKPKTLDAACQYSDEDWNVRRSARQRQRPNWLGIT